MTDRIFERFAHKQYEQGVALAEQSEILSLHPIFGRRDPMLTVMEALAGHRPTLEPKITRGDPPTKYVAHFRCTGLVQEPDGQVVEAHDFFAGLWLPPNYLRHVEPIDVVTWLAPSTVHHPNIRPPLVCMGHIAPGTDLVDLLYQLYEMITYFSFAAHDALAPAAAQWARSNRDRLPLDRRPLKRRLTLVGT